MWPFTKAYSVQIHGRAGLTYKEGGRLLKIDSEMLHGDFDMVIYWSELKRWAPPFDQDELTVAEKSRIKSNVERELKNLRIDWK